MKNPAVLEKRIGYSFKDKEVLRNALTHSSYASENKLGYPANNERLEFIGDAYLDAVVGMKLFEILSDSHEGVLSRYRADVVCEASLSEAARSIGLGDYLLLGRGEDSSGGRDKPSILADAFEALLGAIIIDGGYDSCREVILRLLGSKTEQAATGALSRDFKTKLQEIVQERNNNSVITYTVTDEQGPDHNKTFTVSVSINNTVRGRGTGSSKARAEQAAAEDALSKGVK